MRRVLQTNPLGDTEKNLFRFFRREKILGSASNAVSRDAIDLSCFGSFDVDEYVNNIYFFTYLLTTIVVKRVKDLEGIDL